MPPRRNLFLKRPVSTQAGGVVLPLGVPTIAMAWSQNPNHAWQAGFLIGIRNTGANPITAILVQQSEALAGTFPFNINDAVALPAGETRWYRMEPTPPYVQVQATSAAGSTCDILASETYPIG
jgi:hypothetical protein